jgi:hypothetical protein
VLAIRLVLAIAFKIDFVLLCDVVVPTTRTTINKTFALLSYLVSII